MSLKSFLISVVQRAKMAESFFLTKKKLNSVPTAPTSTSIVTYCPLQSLPNAEINKINCDAINTYLDLVKKQENDELKGFKDGKFYPSPAPEDSTSKDVGYGHKIRIGENYDSGITEPDATELLKNDIARKLENAKKVVENNYPGAWDKLNDKTKLFLTDYEFNTKKGLSGFPLLLNAVVNGNWDTVSHQYTRAWDDGGVKRPLERRNKAIFQTYIKDNLTQQKE